MYVQQLCVVESRYRVQWLVLRLFPSSADGLDEIRFGDLFTTRKVPCSDFGINLHAGVRWDEMF